MPCETAYVYNGRLPTNVMPQNYKLTIKPDLHEFEFSGVVVVDLKVNVSSDTITLNSIDLEFNRVFFQRVDGAQIESTRVVFSKDTETATISFGQKLDEGHGKLCIHYNGHVGDTLAGIYRTKYAHPSGKDRYAIITQFEPADARRAFPCWDEPALKATFDMIIIAESTKTVLSNMPLVTKQPYQDDTSLEVFEFERTPIMSTYLLAFAVGEWEFVEHVGDDGLCMRVYTPLGRKTHGKFGLDLLAKAIPFYTQYFGITYPLPKLDMIAVADHGAGAMENWGLITYDDNELLVDPENTSLTNKQEVALTVAHELAHQWFGNLVTMEWWTDLWLNEGFANFIQYLCIDYCMPHLDVWTNFADYDMSPALKLDSLRSSHPIELHVTSPAQLNEIFDDISYRKGSSVIRMLHNFIGDEAFRVGLHNYLDKFKYKNATTSDLWEILGQAANSNVVEMMQQWTKQMGYPYLDVSVSEQNILTLRQTRFFSDGCMPTEAENFIWNVPVTITTQSSFPNIHTVTTLERTETSLIVQHSDWVKVNAGLIGFFRTNYSHELLQRLASAVREQRLSARERLGLQSDAFALCKAGHLSIHDLLDFIEAFAAETNVTVWRGLISNLNELAALHPIRTDKTNKGNFEAYVRNLLQPITEKLGFEPIDGESDLQAMCREIVFCELSANNHAATIQRANKLFREYLKGKPIPSNQRAAVYIAVCVDADEIVIDQMIQLHNNSELIEEKMRILVALAGVIDEKLIEKVLAFSLSDNVRYNNVIRFIGAVAHNNPAMAWCFVKNNWDVIMQRYSATMAIGRLLKPVIEVFSRNEDHTEIKAFFENHLVPNAQHAIQQALENLQANASWWSRAHNSDLSDDLQARSLRFA